MLLRGFPRWHSNRGKREARVPGANNIVSAAALLGTPDSLDTATGLVHTTRISETHLQQ